MSNKPEGAVVLAWLANNRAARGLGISEGEFALLGSVVQTQWLGPGDRVEIEIDGLGRASAEFLATDARET